MEKTEKAIKQDNVRKEARMLELKESLENANKEMSEKKLKEMKLME